MTIPDRRTSLETILDDLFYAAEKPSNTAVLEACRSYPEFREDILEFAALWATYEASVEPMIIPEDVSETSASRLQSFVLNLLHQPSDKSGPVQGPSAASSIASLRGASLRRAARAAELGDSTLLLQKVLTMRLADVPRIVFRKLAEHLNVTVEHLLIELSPDLAGARSYKAASKPNTPGVETWESAVRGLAVSEDERSRLLGLVDRD